MPSDLDTATSAHGRKETWLHCVGLFAVALFLFHFFGWMVGAPFMTPDAREYLAVSREPWAHFGEIHPTGFAWVLGAGRWVGISERAVIALIAASRSVLLLLLASRFYPGIGRWLVVAAFSLWPEMVVIGFAGWSESLFVDEILLLTLLVASVRSPSLRAVTCLIVFFFMVETRHAAVFFLPALALALGCRQSESNGTIRLGRFCLMTGLWGIVLLASWMSLNFVRSGAPLSPTQSKIECVLHLAAFNRLRYCDLRPDLRICTLDSERKFMGNPEVDINSFIWLPDGPMERLKPLPSEACQIWREAKSALLAQKRTDLAYLILTRFIAQFGPWISSERGAGLYPLQFPEATEWLDYLMIQSNRYSWVLVWILLPVLWVARKTNSTTLRSSLVVLVIGSLGHAFGIALGNPFLVLRYTMIHRYLFVLAGILVLPVACREWGSSIASNVRRIIRLFERDDRPS